MAPLSREEFLIRGCFYVPGALSAWLVANTWMPGWLAEEIASWITVALILAVLYAETRTVRWLKRRYDPEDTTTDTP